MTLPNLLSAHNVSGCCMLLPAFIMPLSLQGHTELTCFSVTLGLHDSRATPTPMLPPDSFKKDTGQTRWLRPLGLTSSTTWLSGEQGSFPGPVLLVLYVPWLPSFQRCLKVSSTVAFLGNTPAWFSSSCLFSQRWSASVRWRCYQLQCNSGTYKKYSCSLSPVLLWNNPKSSSIHQNALGEAFYQTAYAIQEAAGNQSFLLLFLGPKSYDTFKPGWLIFTSNEVNAIYPVNSGPYLNWVERSTLRKWSFLCSLSETPMSIINLA